jgi:hypothetical protein
MTILEEINKTWKSLIEKEKIRLLVTQSPEFLHFLQGLEIRNIFRKIFYTKNWYIEVSYKQRELTFSYYHGNGTFTENLNQSFEKELNQSNGEVELFYKLLKKMEIEKYIEPLALENDLIKAKKFEFKMKE